MNYSRAESVEAEKLYNAHDFAKDPKLRLAWSHLTLDEKKVWYEMVRNALAATPRTKRPINEAASPCAGCGVMPGVEHAGGCALPVTAHARQTAETVEHPAHYGGAENPYEALKVMRAWHGVEPVIHFCILTAEKYLARAGKKAGEPDARDWRKAAFYLNHAADLREE